MAVWKARRLASWVSGSVLASSRRWLVMRCSRSTRSSSTLTVQMIQATSPPDVTASSVMVESGDSTPRSCRAWAK